VASLALSSALLLAVLDARQESKKGRDVQTIDLLFQDRMRQYLLYVPAMPNGSLVLVFHGGGQVAAQIRRISGFDALADREHFIVVYPQAFERSWADGRGVTSAEKQGVNDVAFAKAVVADVARTHVVDRTRVFATGLSNGAALSYRLGCEAADTFAAIAPVAGTIAAGLAEPCRPTQPVAVVGVHGLADPSMPFDGGYVGGSPGGGQVRGVRATQELWRSLNGCAPAVMVTPLAVAVQDGTSVTRRSYANCRGNGDVVAYEIQRGGHRWPPFAFDGPTEALVQRENGLSSRNIDATETIWRFFAGHARR